MEDVKAVLIKLACRVHNMKTISALPREKQVSLAQETLDVFSVVANRLGVWCLKAELEDLAFSVLHPEEYEQLKKQVGGVGACKLWLVWCSHCLLFCPFIAAQGRAVVSDVSDNSCGK